jgi:hypothetical protein
MPYKNISGRVMCLLTTSLVILLTALTTGFFAVALRLNVGHGLLIHTTVGRTPLDECSAHRSDLYLTTHNRQTSMPPAGYEPTMSAGERPQTYALDHEATGTGSYCWVKEFIWCSDELEKFSGRYTILTSERMGYFQMPGLQFCISYWSQG